jgi:hypothetical protein
MVKFIFIVLVLISSTAYAITPDELRAMSNDKSHEESQRNNRVDTDAMETLIPETTNKPVSSKYGNASSNAINKDQSNSGKTQRHIRGQRISKEKPQTNDADSINPDIYVPPPRQGGNTQQAPVIDAVAASLNFGIRLGTWMTAKLNRDTSTAEPGTVELTISEDVIGDQRTLAAGTLVFANKTLNNTTKRMEMVVTHGITPEGREFKLNGRVFDPIKVSGLSGIYTVNDKAIAKHGLQKGIVAAIGSATQSLGAMSPIAAAGGAATQTVITDTGGVVEYNAPSAVIYVSPQPLIIRVDEKF